MSKVCHTLALPTGKSWRQDAACIVEELFRTTPPAAWDILLDLRQNLLHGTDWNHTLDIFLKCREQLEAEHYLPFYRLRNLLTGSLRLEAGQEKMPMSCLRQILRRQHRSLADIRRMVERDVFEHNLDLTPASFSLRVVEA
jgi:hypothetical protein